MISVRKTILLGTLLSCSAVTATTTAIAVAPHPPAGSVNGVNHPTHLRGDPNRGMRAANLDGAFLHAIRQLNLTADQQTTIRGYMETARQQIRTQAAQPHVEAMSNPGDPNYLSAIAAAKNAATARIQQRSDLQVQIYGLLTPEQQGKLPQVLSEMKAQQQQRRADWEQRRQPHSGSPDTAK